MKKINKSILLLTLFYFRINRIEYKSIMYNCKTESLL